MTDDNALVHRVAKAIFRADDMVAKPDFAWGDTTATSYRAMAIAAIDALGLTEEWSVQGHCSESSTDCDHFGEHGPWVCGAVADTREEAAAFPVASEPGAYLVSRLQSPWAPIVGATPVGEQ